MKKVEYILFGVALIAVYVLTAYSSNKKIESVSDSYKSVIAFNNAEKRQLIKADSLKAHYIIKMSQNQVSYKDAIEEFSKELNGFKRAQSLVKSEILTKIEGIEVSYDSSGGKFDGISIIDSNYIHRDTIDKYFVRVPQNASFSDKWLSFDATIGHDFKLDSLSTINKFDIIIGYKNQEKPLSFLRKKEPVVEMKSYSPYSSVHYINNVTFKDDRSGAGKLLTSRAAFFGYGFISSTVLNKL